MSRLDTPSYDMLLGACLSMGLAATGTYDELHARLATHLVKELFDGKRVANRTSKSKRPLTSTSAPKRPATAWHAFLRAEKERVKEAGFEGRVRDPQRVRPWPSQAGGNVRGPAHAHVRRGFIRGVLFG